MINKTGETRLTHRGRFLIMLLLLYVLSLPVLAWTTYLMMKEYSLGHSYRTAGLFLDAIEAVRGYVGQELRPALSARRPSDFVIEGMSRNYASARIAERINRLEPGYSYKDATTTNPRNPANRADKFEADIIELLNSTERLQEWQGMRERGGEEYFVLARRGEPYASSCLGCHGSPSEAPSELLDRYGSVAGFNLQGGQVVDARFVYIPMSVPLGEARRNTLLLVGLYSLLFALAFYYINRRFRALYDRIESFSKETESINADLTELNQALDTLVAERTMGLMAMTVADRVRNPAAVIGGATKGLLESKSPPPEPATRERLEMIEAEARKLEALVREFEALRLSRRSVFKYDDLNETVRFTEPVLRKEAEGLGVALRLELHPEPLRINMQKNLLRAAVLHATRNALEATPDGEAVTLRTELTPEGQAAVVITDTGPGIPEEDRARIFDPFFSTKLMRYGMGLPLIKQAVEEHLGKVEITSTPEQGTTLRLLFPLRWTGTMSTQSEDFSGDLKPRA